MLRFSPVLLLALSLSACVWFRDDDCNAYETRCLNDVAQLCRVSGARTSWGTSMDCRATLAQDGRAQRCQFAAVPQTGFRGFTCVPVAADAGGSAP